MKANVEVKGYITPEGYIDSRLSKLVRTGAMPDTEMRMRGVIPAEAVGHVEQILDLFGVPEEVYNTASYTGLAAVLNPLEKWARPKAIRNSEAGGYKIVSPVELISEPDELVKIANGQTSHQFPSASDQPENLRVLRASFARREAEQLGDNGRMIRYIAGEGQSMDEHIYWLAFPEGSNLLYVATLDTRFRGNDAEVSVYLGTPERDAPDKFMEALQKRVEGLEFKVDDKRFKPKDRQRKSDEMPLPIIAGIGASGF